MQPFGLTSGLIYGTEKFWEDQWPSHCVDLSLHGAQKQRQCPYQHQNNFLEIPSGAKWKSLWWMTNTCYSERPEKISDRISEHRSNGEHHTSWGRSPEAPSGDFWIRALVKRPLALLYSKMAGKAHCAGKPRGVFGGSVTTSRRRVMWQCFRTVGHNAPLPA